MGNKVIASISVLKPVNDTRAFGKIATSLAQTNKYEINIIGFWVKNIPKHPDIRFHPLFRFGRLSARRLLAPWQVFKLLLKLKPEVVIVNTHELLFVTCLNKILFGGLVLYDVQENYYRNIRYTDTYPWLLRIPLALYVRAWEKICSPLIDHFLLAENSYQRDLGFLGKRATVIQNKTSITPVTERNKPKSDITTFLYSGTISTNYGIFDAVSFVSDLNRNKKCARLVIAGHCADKAVYRKLISKIQPFDYIELIGGKEPVPHELIIEAMEKADFALLPYRLDMSIIRCIPTKIYECIALRLPMVMRPNPPWIQLCNQYQACMPCKFDKTEPDFLNLLLYKKFYSKGDPGLITWKHEAPKLLAVMNALPT